jgi:hypothetical protein
MLEDEWIYWIWWMGGGIIIFSEEMEIMKNMFNS